MATFNFEDFKSAMCDELKRSVKPNFQNKEEIKDWFMDAAWRAFGLLMIKQGLKLVPDNYNVVP